MIGKLFGKKPDNSKPTNTAQDAVIAQLFEDPGAAPVVASSFHMTARQIGAAVDVRIICDKLDQRLCDVLKAEIGGVLDLGYNRLTLDLSEVTLLPSAGLGLLIVLRDRLKTTKGKIALYGASPDIVGLLKMTKLDQFMPCHGSRAEAHAAVT